MEMREGLKSCLDKLWYLLKPHEVDLGEGTKFLGWYVGSFYKELMVRLGAEGIKFRTRKNRFISISGDHITLYGAEVEESQFERARKIVDQLYS
jgi:hypothetical protein